MAGAPAGPHPVAGPPGHRPPLAGHRHGGPVRRHDGHRGAGGPRARGGFRQFDERLPGVRSQALDFSARPAYGARVLAASTAMLQALRPSRVTRWWRASAAAGLFFGGRMYIAVDLKVIEGKAAAVARAAEATEDRVLAGLVRLWHRVWCDKTDHLASATIAGCFGSDGLPKLLAALEAIGFLEPTGDSFRVRGAARYLRLRAALSAGGEASKGNLKRGTSPGPRAGEKPGPPPGSVPALSPSTEHREIKLLRDTPSESPPAGVAKKPRKPSRQESWWQSAQEAASAKNPGRVTEGHQPKELNTLLGPPLEAIGVAGLTAAWGKYLEDPHWSSKGWPLRGFVSQWEKFHNLRTAPPAPKKWDGGNDYDTPAKVYG